MANPTVRVRPKSGRPILKLRHKFWIALLATALIMVVMNGIGAPLVTEAAPLGIVSFELAGSAQETVRILESWDTQARLNAAFSLGLDYLFMVAYGLALWLGTASAAATLAARSWPPGAYGRFLVWLAPAAVLCDAGENAFLLRQLLQNPSDTMAWLAAMLAAVKFVLIFVALVFGFYALVVFRLVRLPDSAVDER